MSTGIISEGGPAGGGGGWRRRLEEEEEEAGVSATVTVSAECGTL
jgi:hypothetical protein